MRKRVRNFAIIVSLACSFGLFGLLLLAPVQVSALTDETEQKILDVAQADYGQVAKSTLCGPSTPSCESSTTATFNTCFADIINDVGFTFPEASPPDFKLEDLAKCTVGSGRSHTALLAAFNAEKASVDQKIQDLIDAEVTTTEECSIDGNLAWMTCPISMEIADFISQTLTPLINSLLFVSTDNTFTPEFKKAWDSFRNIGIALIVIAGLIMVISQAFGLDILDAYTIKKLMPRLAVALVFMALSWPLLRLGIGFVNDLGIWAHDLIISPFKSNNIGYDGLSEDSTGSGGLSFLNKVVETMVVVAGATGVYINGAILGFAGILSLLGTTTLALFIGWLVLAIRQTVIVAAVIMAPLAIAAYVLPGTQKIWKFWKDALITSLVMFPIVMGFIGAGEALSRIMTEHPGTNSQFTNIQAFLVLIAPYFMLPFAFKLAGGLIATVFSMANDRSKGLFERGRKFRGDTKNWRRGEIASGTLKSNSLASGWAGRTALAREGGMESLIPYNRAAKARYRHAREKLQEHTARERAEKDHGFSLGDTDETRAAIFADDRASFAARYRAIKHAKNEYVDDRQVENAIARLEAGTGARMGTNVMKASAMRGQTVLDGAGWFNEDENRFDLEGFGEAAHHLAQRGIFRAEDLGAMLGENQQRPDMGASSFSQRVAMAQTAIDNGGTYTADEMSLIYGRTYQSMRNSSAQLANLRTAKTVAKQGGQRLDSTLRGHTLAGIDSKSGTQKGASEDLSAVDRLTSEFATFANFQDMASSASPVAREQFAFQMQQTHTGEEMDAGMRTILSPLLAANNNKVSNQQIMEYLRGNAYGVVYDSAGNAQSYRAEQEVVDKFTARRREYGSARDVAGAAQGVRVDPVKAGGGPP